MILQISYGLDINSIEDEYMKLVRKGNDIFMEAFVPGKYLVETFPILKRVPAWFPSAKFRREAREWKEAYEQVRVRPFQAAMELMVGFHFHGYLRLSSVLVANLLNRVRLASR